MEIWRVIEQHPTYEVSDLGRIRNNKGVVLKQSLSSRYATVSLRGKTTAVHPLVAYAFIGPRPAGMYVLHTDGNRLNNYAINLRYGTPADNVADARKHGTWAQGWQSAESVGVVLRPDEVTTIVKLLADGETQQSIADRYGVEQTTISHIKLGKNWAWLTGLGGS